VLTASECGSLDNACLLSHSLPMLSDFLDPKIGNKVGEVLMRLALRNLMIGEVPPVSSQRIYLFNIHATNYPVRK
jgi:hypothetical protein